MDRNRVKEMLMELSMKLHEMEEQGVELTDEEDDLWLKITLLIEAK